MMVRRRSDGGRTGSGRAVLGLGTAAMGRPGYITTDHGADLAGAADVESMARNAHAVLDRAYAGGIRSFDTARSYGRGEEFLASWLDHRRPDDVFVASKWGYRYVADWHADADVHEVKDHSLSALRRQLIETRALLGDRLDLYQVHSVTPDSPIFEDQPLLQALHDLKSGGTAVGFSASGPEQGAVIERAIGVKVEGEPLFDAVQATWNLLETSATSALVEAADAGMTVIVKEALANGRLVRSSSGTPADAAALAAALHQPFAHVVLSGAVSTSQLEANLVALTIADPPEPSPIDPALYWQQRSERPWT